MTEIINSNTTNNNTTNNNTMNINNLGNKNGVVGIGVEDDGTDETYIVE